MCIFTVFHETFPIKYLFQIGAGSQGAVFSGKFNGEMVAVKKVKEVSETDIRHLRHLKHKNVIEFKYVPV